MGVRALSKLGSNRLSILRRALPRLSPTGCRSDAVAAERRLRTGIL